MGETMDLSRLNSVTFVDREQRAIATATAVGLTVMGAVALADAGRWRAGALSLRNTSLPFS